MAAEEVIGPVRIHREGSNVALVAEVDGQEIKYYVELDAWEERSHRAGEEFWDFAQARFEAMRGGA